MTRQQPMCGKCGKPMTPQDSRIHPEFFLHDACLPEDLRLKASEQAPEKIEPLKIAADLLRLKPMPELPATYEGKDVVALEQAMRLGAVCIRLLHDENVKLKATPWDVLGENSDLRELVKCQSNLLASYRTGSRPSDSTLDKIVALKEKLGVK